MKKVLLFASVFLFLFISVVETKAQFPVQTGEIPKDLLISLERKFHCIDLSGNMSDKCRDYSLKVGADGNVALKIEENHKNKAQNIEFKISKKKIKRLINAFDKANFYQLRNKYTDGEICKVIATEQPDEALFIQINGKKKQVQHYLGCYIDEKETIVALLSLGNKIDEIVETKRWIGERKY